MADEKSLRMPTVRLELKSAASVTSPRVARSSGPGPVPPLRPGTFFTSGRSGADVGGQGRARGPVVQALHQAHPVEPSAVPRSGGPMGRGVYYGGFAVGEVAESAEGSRLLSGYRPKALSRVRILPLRHAPLAQVDRASGYESEGQRFESSRAHHSPHDEAWMRQALVEAERGGAADEVPIGAVVVIDGASSRAPTMHRSPSTILPRTPRSWPCERRPAKSATTGYPRQRSTSPWSRVRCAAAWF